jgi:hypothetical protein
VFVLYLQTLPEVNRRNIATVAKLAIMCTYSTAGGVFSERWGDEQFTDFVISSYRCEVNQNCILLRCYTASSGTSLPTFRDNLLVPKHKDKEFKVTLEDGKERLFRNVGVVVPLLAVL